MLNGCEMEIVKLNDLQQFREVQTFLGQFSLTFERGVEYTINFRRDGKIIGTGSFTGEVLHNIAVDKTMQGSGLVATIVSELMQELARRGRFHYFIFTKPCISHVFKRLGFDEIACAEPYVSLLETGIGSVSAYCDQLKKRIAHIEGDRTAVILNGHSLSYHHWLIIEQEAKENNAVIVFLMNGEQSSIPITDLYNIMLVPADKYILPSAVFQTYFVPKEDQQISRTRLDISLFAAQIAPRLGIKRCYTGEAPNSTVIDGYNQAMQDILPNYGIDLRILKQMERSLVTTG